MSSWSYDTDVHPRERLAHYIVTTAGSIMMDLFHKKIRKGEKALHDYVTELDTNIETHARNAVMQSFPNDAIAGEEGTEVQGSSGFLWVIDPIDGTNNYVRGLPFAGVQIALFKDGEVIYGLIYRPFTQDLYTAVRGKGALYENRLTGERRKLHVSNKPIEQAIGIFDAKVGKTGNPSTAIFDGLIDTISMARVFGVASYDIPAVAEGSVEFLVSGIAKPYDVAAGWLLVEEAGGVVYGLSPQVAINERLLIFGNSETRQAIEGVVHG